MLEHPRFPMFVDLSERRAVVVGAGRIAARRVAVLAQFCPNVTVVAPEIHADILALAGSGAVRVVRRAFEARDIDGADLVLAATNDANLNAAIREACAARGIPVNVSSDKALCDFYFPGIVHEGGVVVGVTANGEDHRRAKRATDAICDALRRLPEDAAEED